MVVSMLGCAIDDHDDVELAEKESFDIGVPPPVSISFKPIVDRVLMSYGKPLVGLSVIVIKDGVTGIYHYGEAVDGSGQKPTNDTYYAIASLTKTFTSTLLALSERQGYVNVHDRLQARLPPPPAGQPAFTLGGDRDQIRLSDLALHRSGLARDVPGARSEFQLGNQDADHVAMMRTLADCESAPCDPPIAPWEDEGLYSNWAYETLAYVLAKRRGNYVPDAFRNQLLFPLGMNHTGFKYELVQPTCVTQGTTCTFADYGDCSFTAACNGTFSARAAVGYRDVNGVVTRSSTQGTDRSTLMGSGGLWSTPRDMATWLAFHMHGTGGTSNMQSVLPSLRYPYTDDESTLLGQWRHTAGRVRYLQKNGKLNRQFRSFMGYTDDERVGVIVLTNYYDFNPDVFGALLIDALH
jgi:CubicO group peptidase (beta-lactamase class C family)